LLKVVCFFGDNEVSSYVSWVRMYIKVRWALSAPRACTLTRDEVSAHVSWVRTWYVVRMFGDDEVSLLAFSGTTRTPRGFWQGKGRCRTCRCRPKQVLHKGFQEGFGNGVLPC